VHTHSLYGPGFTLVSAAIARTWAGSAGATILAFKLLAGVAIAAATGFVAIAAARIRPERAALAAALVGLNPVLVVHTVGGGHVDALIAAPLAAALAIAVTSPRAVSARAIVMTALLTVACLVKAVVVPALAEKARTLSIGDGAADGVMVGPLVSCAQRDRVRDWIDRGERDGATVLVDGCDPSGVNRDGAFVGPTLLTDVTPEMDIAQQEVFGPVLSVIHVDTLDDAIDVVNRSRYGNGTSIFTEPGAAVRRYRHDVEVGMIGVNVGVAAPVAFFPFSGWKDSFLGDLHAHGTDAVDFYTRKKTVTSRWFSSGQGHGSYFVEQ